MLKRVGDILGRGTRAHMGADHERLPSPGDGKALANTGVDAGLHRLSDPVLGKVLIVRIGNKYHGHRAKFLKQHSSSGTLSLPLCCCFVPQSSFLGEETFHNHQSPVSSKGV